jgi:hypothetical protein
LWQLFYAENQKEWKFLHKIILVGSFFEFFAVLSIAFLEGPIFWPKKHPKTKLTLLMKLDIIPVSPQKTFQESRQESRKNTHFAN